MSSPDILIEDNEEVKNEDIDFLMIPDNTVSSYDKLRDNSERLKSKNISTS